MYNCRCIFMRGLTKIQPESRRDGNEHHKRAVSDLPTKQRRKFLNRDREGLLGKEWVCHWCKTPPTWCSISVFVSKSHSLHEWSKLSTANTWCITLQQIQLHMSVIVYKKVARIAYICYRHALLTRLCLRIFLKDGKRVAILFDSDLPTLPLVCHCEKIKIVGRVVRESKEREGVGGERERENRHTSQDSINRQSRLQHRMLKRERLEWERWWPGDEKR